MAWLESHAHALRRVHIHTTICMHMWCPTSLLQIVINPTAVSECGRTGCRNSAGQPCICMWLGGRAEHDLIWATLDTCAVAPEGCGFDRVMGQDGDRTG
jgi:hypothetical protein